MKEFDYSYYEYHWLEIRNQIMDELGYTDEDLDDDSIEDEVNRETDDEFYNQFGFDINDVED